MTKKRADEAGGEKAEPSFEKALDRLETIVADMESGKLSLEAMMAGFEEGQALIELCTKKLNEVERRIEILVKKGDTVETEPFPVPDDDEGQEDK